MSDYRSARVEVSLELDDSVRRRIDEVVELGSGALDRAGVILAAMERGLPALEAEAALFAARNVALCPRCGERVVHNDIGALRLTRCPACAGFWVDATTAAQLVAASIAIPEIRELAARAAAAGGSVVDITPLLVCPVCRRPLDRRRFALVSVVVDVCERHGTWFDRGELSSLMRTLEAHAEQRLTVGDPELAAEVDALKRLLAVKTAPAWP